MKNSNSMPLNDFLDYSSKMQWDLLNIQDKVNFFAKIILLNHAIVILTNLIR